MRKNFSSSRSLISFQPIKDPITPDEAFAMSKLMSMRIRTIFYKFMVDFKKVFISKNVRDRETMRLLNKKSIEQYSQRSAARFRA